MHRLKTTCKRGLGALVPVLLLTLLVAPVARADLVGEFNARLKNIKLSYGAYTAVFESRVYDTTGVPPPQLKYAEIHFPRGASIRREFLTTKFYCDTALLEQTANPAVCSNSRFAKGLVLLDARPEIADAIPSDLFLFLARPREPGATATVAVLVVSNQRTPVYASQVLYGSLFPDSGLFGYRLTLPTTIKPLVPGLNLALAELNLNVAGLTLKKKQKIKRGRRSGSVTKKVFWTKVPRCTKKKRVTFAADYQFQNGNRIHKEKTIKCSAFLRKPSANDKGGIPNS